MIAALILAAGGSRRLGSPKQLVETHGLSLIERAVHVGSSVGALYVVTGHAASDVAARVGARARCVHNEAWADGLGSSLRLGIAALESAHDDVRGVLVLTCDQHRIDVAHARLLVAGLDEKPIAASAYDGVVGVPAAFRREIFDELRACSGDRGAREVIRRDAQRVLAIPCQAAAVDLDDPADLVALQQSASGSHQVRKRR